jgi:hypothetical protein
MKPLATLPPKKPYSIPKLFVYGDLTEMTKAMGPVGRKDGGGAFKSKTG